MDYSREEEIRKAQKNIDDFLNSEAFQKIVEIFHHGEKLYDLDEINLLAEEWDYRRKIAQGGERQQITEEDPFVAEHREEIIQSFRELGMLYEKEIDFPAPDYILPLGGFGLSNLKRCLIAKKLSDAYRDKEIRIVGLSSHREILQQLEFEQIKDAFPAAKTEFEEMDASLRIAFDLNEVRSAKTYNEKDSREYWSILTYASSDPLRRYHNLSAPCYDSKRTRANTVDTFVHLLRCMNVRVGSKLILASTALYGPYQMYSLLPTAIEYGVELYFFGGDYKERDEEILATLCLVDLKSAVNAMAAFRKKYPKE